MHIVDLSFSKKCNLMRMKDGDKDYKFYLDLAEKGQKGPTAKQHRMMTAMKRILGE